MNGIDISDFQGQIDWSLASKDPNCQFVFAQATYGITGTNATFYGNHDGCKANGIPFGAYHFFYARDPGDRQAQHFLDFIDGYEGTLLPMVDIEQASLDGFDGTAEQFFSELVDFDAVLRGRLPPNKLPILYWEYSFWKDYLGGNDAFAGHDAWPAAYNSDPTLDMTGTGWKDWTIWQWSNGSGLPSIAGVSADVDRDRLNPEINLAAILRYGAT